MHKNTSILHIQLDGYPGHSPKRRIRPAPLAPNLIDAHPNFEQSRTVSLHEPQFRLIIDIRLAQHQLRMPPGRNLVRKVEQPHELARRFVFVLLFVVVALGHLDRWLAQDGRQFVGDAREYARWSQHAEMRDAQRAIWVFGI